MNDPHEPLPYLVTLRVVYGQDQPPELHTRPVDAYSLSEAVMAACLELQDLLPSKAIVTVQQAGPDIERWRKMVRDLRDAAARLKAKTS